MEKIVVDQDLCICCGACVSICDEVFDFTEQGDTAKTTEGKNILDNLDENIKENALEAKDSCPVGAIKIEEEKTN